MLGEDHHLIVCADFSRLREVLRNRAVEGCIVDIYGGPHRIPFRELQRLRRRQPPVAIVVHSDFRDREMDLFELGRLDVDGVIPAGPDEDTRTIRDTVRHALGGVIALRVREALHGRLPVAGLDCLGWAVEHATLGPTVGELAAAFGLSGRSLARELRERGLPSPNQFLLWGRLFQAAHLMNGPGRTVEEAAYAVGYSSAAALSRVFRQRTGSPPSEVVRKGGVALLIQSFLEVCGSGERSGGGRGGSEP